MARILIVEDEPAIAMALRDELQFEGHDVATAVTGITGLDLARKFNPDVVLLDVMLPEMNGFEVCRQLRAEMVNVWIIMLTVRAQETDRIRGLEQGADDYVTKPFSLREVAARINVGLRRQRVDAPGPNIRFGDVEVDLKAYRVTKAGADVSLTTTEFEILVLLIERAGEVVRRDDFLDRLWADVEVVPRVVDTHMASLRKKIESDPNQPIHIQSVRGVGYRLDLIAAQS